MNDRALSTAVGYVLGLSIMLLLSTGLFITGGSFIDDQREGAIRSELQVVGQQIANDVSRVDRVVNGSSPPAGILSNVSTDQTVPPEVAGTTYNIEVRDPSGGTPHLLLSTNSPDISVRVNMTVKNPLRQTAFDGGRVIVRYNNTASELEVIDG